MVLPKKRASRSKKAAKSGVQAHNAAGKIVTSRQMQAKWTNKLPTKDDLKANGRTKGRNLVQWFSAGKAEQALLAMIYECNVAGIQLPFDKIAHRINPGSSGESLKQHFPKLREELLEQGFAVPPRITKRRNFQEEVRVYVRDDSQPEKERGVGWSELVDEPKDLLPVAPKFDDRDTDGFSVCDENEGMDFKEDSMVEDRSDGSGDGSLVMSTPALTVLGSSAGSGVSPNIPPANTANNKPPGTQSPDFLNIDNLPDFDEVLQELATYEPANVGKSPLDIALEAWDPVLLLPDNGGSDIDAVMQHSMFLPTEEGPSPTTSSLNGQIPDFLLSFDLQGSGGAAVPHETFSPTNAYPGTLLASQNDPMAGTMPDFSKPLGLSDIRGLSSDVAMPHGTLLPADEEFVANLVSLENSMADTIPNFMPPFDLPSLPATGGLEFLEQYQ